MDRSRSKSVLNGGRAWGKRQVKGQKYAYKMAKIVFPNRDKDTKGYPHPPSSIV